MNNVAWIEQVAAASEPIPDRPEVRCVGLEDFSDVIRFLRFLGLRAENGKALWKVLRAQIGGDLRIVSGLSRRADLVGAWVASVGRGYNGKRHARLSWWIGGPQQAGVLERLAEQHVGRLRDELARRGEFPVNSQL